MLENGSMLSCSTWQAFPYNPYFTTDFPSLDIAFAKNIVVLQDDRKSQIPEKTVLISITSCATSPYEALCYAFVCALSELCWDTTFE